MNLNLTREMCRQDTKAVPTALTGALGSKAHITVKTAVQCRINFGKFVLKTSHMQLEK